jgi:hypothetical protein
MKLAAKDLDVTQRAPDDAFDLIFFSQTLLSKPASYYNTVSPSISRHLREGM